MPEDMAVRAVVDTAQQGIKFAETAVRKAWSILDAVSEKKTPSEYLSQQAVNAIQGLDPSRGNSSG